MAEKWTFFDGFMTVDPSNQELCKCQARMMRKMAADTSFSQSDRRRYKEIAERIEREIED